jgi:O-methyltransferase
METKNNQKEELYKRSLPIRMAKRLLLLSKSILPKKYYNLFYKIPLKGYKALVRLAYLRFVIYHTLAGNKEEAEKCKLIYRVMPYSLVGSLGLAQTYDAVKEVIKNNIEGGFVECGVAQGGSSALIALVAFKGNGNEEGRKLFLFDSFEGLPDPTEDDFLEKEKSAGDFIRPLEKGSCLGTHEQVENLFLNKLGIEQENIEMVKGWFEDTLPGAKERINNISLLRIDADWYESTKCCLENLYDKVSDNGIIIIDDYGTCHGAKKALDEFLSKRELNVKLEHDGRGGCLFRKTNLN